jgi:hypothetical protein
VTAPLALGPVNNNPRAYQKASLFMAQASAMPENSARLGAEIPQRA